RIEVSENAPAGSAAKSAASAPSPAGSTDKKETYATGHASPAAAKILAEKGIDPSGIEGTGKDGRITKEDAEKAQKPAPKSSPAPAKTTTAGGDEDKAPVAGAAWSRNTRRERMTTLRKTIS